MSMEHVKEIIGKAISDSEYWELLFNDLNKVMEGYDLTDEEVAALKALETEQFDTVAGELEERISKANLSEFTKYIDNATPNLSQFFGDLGVK